mgnify:CR=1 FL=1
MSLAEVRTICRPRREGASTMVNREVKLAGITVVVSPRCRTKNLRVPSLLQEMLTSSRVSKTISNVAVPSWITISSSDAFRLNLHCGGTHLENQELPLSAMLGS